MSLVIFNKELRVSHWSFVQIHLRYQEGLRGKGYCTKTDKLDETAKPPKHRLGGLALEGLTTHAGLIFLSPATRRGKRKKSLYWYLFKNSFCCQNYIRWPQLPNENADNCFLKKDQPQLLTADRSLATCSRDALPGFSKGLEEGEHCWM